MNWWQGDDDAYGRMMERDFEQRYERKFGESEDDEFDDDDDESLSFNENEE